MLDLSRDIEEAAARFVRQLRRDKAQERRKVNSVHVDDYGQAHVKGGMFNATGGRDYHLSIHGLTRADVTAFRRTLKKRLGFEPPCAMAEALLIQTDKTPEATAIDEATEKRRKRERDKKARRRQWARDRGYCIVCCKNAVSYTSEGKDMATCQECRDRVSEHRKRAE